MYTRVTEEPHSESRSYSDVRKLKTVKYPYGQILTNYRLFVLYLYILYYIYASDTKREEINCLYFPTLNFQIEKV